MGMWARIQCICSTTCFLTLACGSSDGTSQRSFDGGPTSGGALGAGGAGHGGVVGMGGGMPPGVRVVLEPSLPTPSHDCRTDTQSRDCVSISGTLAGTPIDRHQAKPNSPTFFTGAGAAGWAWVAGGWEGGVPNAGYYYQVNIPVQPPGRFDFTIAPHGGTSAPYVGAALDSAGADTYTENLASAEIAGWVEHDAVSGDDTFAGTFRGIWSAPQSSCGGGPANTCAAADVQGTFRTIYSLHSCTSDSDCASNRCIAGAICSTP